MFPQEKSLSLVPEHALIPAHDGAYRVRWTREQMHRMYDEGIMDQQKRYELIAGGLFQKMSMNAPHASVMSKAFRRLFRLLGQHFEVRSQSPLVLATDGQPEPDIFVLRGKEEDYDNRFPTQDDALLVVEVSDTTLGFDRGRKGAYYAEAGIAEYWIVNITERQVEVYRRPHADPAAEWGFAYDAPVIARVGDT
ncbi:MAG: Uma2 family endonuclease, partial [Armatimonadetes bacterium]|nr:Uma2 family endonuclease [Armatimonadota bacterium]